MTSTDDVINSMSKRMAKLGRQQQEALPIRVNGTTET